MDTFNNTSTQGYTSSRADWLSKVPVPIFGAALGLLGLSLITAKNEYIVEIQIIKIISLVLGTVVLVLSILIHLLRLTIRRDAFIKDFRNIGIAPFFGQIGVALLLLAEGVIEFDGQIAQAIYISGCWVSALLTFYWLFMIFRQKFALSSVTPSWLVPPIGLLYIGLLAPVFNMTAIYVPALIAGSVTAIGAFGLLCTRLIMGPSLPPMAKPGLAIGVAIPALMLLALMGSATLRLSIFSIILFYITAFSYIVAIVAFARIIIGQFMVSWWAFGMPLIAATVAFSEFSRVHTSMFINALVYASAFLEFLIVLGLSIISMMAVRKNIYYSKFD